MDEEAIKQLLAAYGEKWSKHDMTAWGKLFTGDVDYVNQINEKDSLRYPRWQHLCHGFGFNEVSHAGENEQNASPMATAPLRSQRSEMGSQS